MAPHSGIWGNTAKSPTMETVAGALILALTVLMGAQIQLTKSCVFQLRAPITPLQ